MQERRRLGWRRSLNEAGAWRAACSEDRTVTLLQGFALQLLAARADVALWLNGVPGSHGGAVAGRLAEIRHSCENDLPSRIAGATSPYTAACTHVLAKTALPADGDALFAALGDAYTLIATDLAARDGTIDPEPATLAEAAPAATPAAS